MDTPTNTPESPVLRTGEQVLRLAVLARVTGMSLVDVLEVWAWLHGWPPYTPVADTAVVPVMPEVLVSRIAALDVPVDELRRELGAFIEPVLRRS